MKNNYVSGISILSLLVSVAVVRAGDFRTSSQGRTPLVSTTLPYGRYSGVSGGSPGDTFLNPHMMRSAFDDIESLPLSSNAPNFSSSQSIEAGASEEDEAPRSGVFVAPSSNPIDPSDLSRTSSVSTVSSSEAETKHGASESGVFVAPSSNPIDPSDLSRTSSVSTVSPSEAETKKPGGRPDDKMIEKINGKIKVVAHVPHRDWRALATQYWTLMGNKMSDFPDNFPDHELTDDSNIHKFPDEIDIDTLNLIGKNKMTQFVRNHGFIYYGPNGVGRSLNGFLNAKKIFEMALWIGNKINDLSDAKHALDAIEDSLRGKSNQIFRPGAFIELQKMYQKSMQDLQGNEERGLSFRMKDMPRITAPR